MGENSYFLRTERLLSTAPELFNSAQGGFELIRILDAEVYLIR